MKIAPLVSQLRAKSREQAPHLSPLSWKLIHTGQHYDLLQEPGLMWKRYAATNPVLVRMVIKEYFKKKMTGSDHHAA